MADNCPFEITPLAHTKAIRNTNVFSLNYTNQDYWSLKARMLDLMKQHFDKDFNDFTESSIGIMLIEMWAFIADTLSFKIDQLANEIFIDTVTEPANAFRLARLVGFKPTPPLPARALFVATINHPLSTDLEIVTPLLIDYSVPGYGEKVLELYPTDHENNPVMDSPIVIPAGQLSTSRIVGIEGRTIAKNVKGTGAPNQVIEVDNRQILSKSIRVAVDGIYWTEVEYFTDSQPRREYRVEYTSNYRGFVVFGNGRSGLMPPTGSDIGVAYRIGGGIGGNIITGAIDKPVQIKAQGLQHLLTVNVKNYTKAEFGYDGDSIDDIRRKLPVYLRTQDRCVTGMDYKALADNFVTPYNGQVGKSTAVLRNHGCAGNIIDLFVLAREGQSGLVKAGENLKNELRTELEKKKMITDHVCVRDGDIVEVDIHINIVVDKEFRKSINSLRERAERRMNYLFLLNNWEYGQPLRDSDIIKNLADLKEAETIDVSFTTTHSIESGDGSTNVISPRYNEIIRPDNVILHFSYKE